MKSSFVKKSKNLPPTLPGTKGSPEGHLVISTGVEDLDQILEGGFFLGSLVLLQEDVVSKYYQAFVRCFMGESYICNKTQNFILDGQMTKDRWVSGMPHVNLKSSEPEPDTTQSEDSKKDAADSSEMKIAWRYEGLETSNRAKLSSLDLSRTLQRTLSEQNPLQFIDISKAKSMKSLFDQIIEQVLNTQDSSEDKTVRKFLLHSFGSLEWPYESPKELLEFLKALKAFARSTYATFILTTPINGLSPGLLNKFIHMSDYTINIHSFTYTHEEFRDFHGMVNLVKLPLMHSYASIKPETLCYVFKQNRKDLSIEKMHLPPEEDRTSSDASLRQGDQVKPAKTACGTSGGKALDF